MRSIQPGFPLLKIHIKFERDVVTARQKTRKISEALGFGNQDQARLATAVSELARNVYQYARSGEIEFFCSQQEPQTLFVKVTDGGSGIKNLTEVLSGKYVSKTGMGVGLVGSKKLVDKFEIETSAQSGTVVLIGKILEKSIKSFSAEDLSLIRQKIHQLDPGNSFEEIQTHNKQLLAALEEAKASRAELAELNLELAATNQGMISLFAEIDEKTSSLQKAVQQAEIANQAKSQFLSNMSHEIRTPLGIIQGFIDLALEPDTSEDERQDYLHTVKRNASSLTRLLGEILDLAKIEANRIEIEKTKFSLLDLLQEVVSAFELKAKENAIRLSFQTSGLFPTQVLSDSTKVRQILINLVSNALKFTERGEVCIRAWVEDLTSEITQISIEVQDTGIGLSPAQQVRLFEPFMQADSSTTRKYGGTGLGLSLSRSLSQALGGDLVLSRSEVGVGSAFLMNFDAGIIERHEFLKHDSNDSQVNSVPMPSVQKNLLLGMRFLIVDDSVDLQRLCEKYLVHSGASVELAHDGLQALEKARAGLFDAILMDIQMPNLDGFGATRILREEGSSVPIVALTAHALKEDRDKGLQGGFNAYLTKPLIPSLLLQTMAQYRKLS